MSLGICSLASGSSGNCYAVASSKAALLVDAGISGKQIRERLAARGINEARLAALLITHEHADHVKGLPVVCKLGLPVYANEKTLAGINAELDPQLIHCFVSGEAFDVEDIHVQSFGVSHDAADPVGYSFSDGRTRVAIITDTGVVTPAIKEQMAAADILVLESNHDENILRMGPYPWFLKQRILSEKGHLSNDAAATALAEVLLAQKDKQTVPKQVLLAHLSKENNFPEMARATMENVLLEKGVSPRQIELQILSRTEAGSFIWRD